MRKFIFIIASLLMMEDHVHSQEPLTCFNQTVRNQGKECLNIAVDKFEEAVSTLHSIINNIHAFQTSYQTQNDVAMTTGRNCGVEDGTIPDSAMTSSGYWQYSDNIGYAPFEGRLNNDHFWHRARGDPHPWLQVDLGKTNLVTGVVTQGRPHLELRDWVTEFKIKYGTEANMMNYLSYNRRDIVFPGNTDKNTPKVTMFPMPVQARYIRFICVTWSREPVLRVEILGCH